MPWSFQRKLAERAVARLTGVTGIVNLLRVSDRQTQMQAVTDIHAALRRAADIEADAIEVLIADGTVTLRGTVSSARAKRPHTTRFVRLMAFIRCATRFASGKTTDRRSCQFAAAK